MVCYDMIRQQQLQLQMEYPPFLFHRFASFRFVSFRFVSHHFYLQYLPCCLLATYCLPTYQPTYHITRCLFNKKREKAAKGYITYITYITLHYIYNNYSSIQDKTKRGETRRDNTRQDETRQDKTRQDKINQPTNQHLYLYLYPHLSISISIYPLIVLPITVKVKGIYSRFRIRSRSEWIDKYLLPPPQNKRPDLDLVRSFVRSFVFM